MSNLYLGNKTEKIESVFQLLGVHENDMSYSLAWGLAQCPKFLEKFLIAINQRNTELSEVEINLQKSGDKKEGITDIELIASKFIVIIEAKRGWGRPSNSQLDKYAKRIKKSALPNKKLIVLSEYSKINTGDWLKKWIRGIPLQPISWREAIGCAKQALSGSSHAQKHLIKELIVYFNKIMTKQKLDSNEVFVVALNANKKVDNWLSPPVDVVTKLGRYFHPVGNNWPKEPPNYIAFRYHGKLQSIHHIDEYKVTQNLKEYLIKHKKSDHFLYTLGPAIKPIKEIKTGNKINRAQRVWCMLDTLLTSKTISEARDISKKRKLKEE